MLFCHCCSHLLFWATQLLLFSRGLIHEDQRAKVFFKEKEKLSPSADPKTALLIQKFLFSVIEQSVKGRNVGPGLPNGKENYSQQFLYNMYRARCKPAPQIQNTQYLKTNRNRDGHLAPPHRSLAGQHQAEIQSHPPGGVDSG